MSIPLPNGGGVLVTFPTSPKARWSFGGDPHGTWIESTVYPPAFYRLMHRWFFDIHWRECK